MSNHWIPVGGPVALGFFENAFGDAHFMIQRELFESLCGFGEDRAAFEDAELLMRTAAAPLHPGALATARRALRQLEKAGERQRAAGTLP